MASASCSSPSLASSKSETRVFKMGSSSESSKTSFNPSSEDKSALGLREAELDGRRGDNQGKDILHDLGEGNERIVGRHDKRSSRRGALSLGHPCKSNSLLKSKDLGKSKGGFLMITLSA